MNFVHKKAFPNLIFSRGLDSKSAVVSDHADYFLPTKSKARESRVGTKKDIFDFNNVITCNVFEIILILC